MTIASGIPATLAALLLASCSRYTEFTLPVLTGSDLRTTFVFEERPEPILTRGSWHDALNPTVAGNTMLYSAWDGKTWHTAQAVSPDGLRWQDHGVILSPDPRTWEGTYSAANGTALQVGGELWHWYVAGPEERPAIGLVRGNRKEPHPVLEPGPFMSWDERGVADPYVIQAGPWFYLYFLGQDRALRQRLGVARSQDGIHWQKLRTNPILETAGPGEFDENGLGEPAVWVSHGFYWMLYTGRGGDETRRLGLARSTDGVHWTRLPTVFSGSQPWDSKVICDPTVQVNGGEIRVWFGGGNLARQDYDLNGQIGYGVLRATLGK
jgi:glycosyl hydrolase family 32